MVIRIKANTSRDCIKRSPLLICLQIILVLFGIFSAIVSPAAAHAQQSAPSAEKLNQDTFLIGWVSYANQTDRWQRYAEEGSNIVFSYGSGLYLGNTAQTNIESARRNGLKLILDYHWHPNLWEGTYPATMEQYEAFARENRTNPVIYAHYIADEPEGFWNDRNYARAEPVSFFEPIYNSFRRGSPEIPVMVAHSNRAVPEYMSIQDIVNVDCYPNWGGGSGQIFGREVRSCYDSWLSGMNAKRQYNKRGFIATGLGWGSANGNGLRDLTIPEYRWHVFSAVVLGADAFLFYDANDADSAVYNRVTQMIREVRAIGDQMYAGVTNGGGVSASVPQSSLVYRYGVRNGKGVLLAVNIADYQVSNNGQRLPSVTFTLPAGTVASKVNVLNENRSIPVTNGSFTDAFDPFAVHIYEISAAPDTPFGTATATIRPLSPSPAASHTPASVTPVSGSTCPLKSSGDANCDGIIDDADYKIWQEEYLELVPTTQTDFDGISTCRTATGGVKHVCLADLEIQLRNRGPLQH
ncbi:MAG: hypothetical protein N2691_05695 [Patescibacteria group bacterium]|nr:hypothetical protein [Patescibacteria group bacterium]